MFGAVFEPVWNEDRLVWEGFLKGIFMLAAPPAWPPGGRADAIREIAKCLSITLRGWSPSSQRCNPHGQAATSAGVLLFQSLGKSTGSVYWWGLSRLYSNVIERHPSEVVTSARRASDQRCRTHSARHASGCRPLASAATHQREQGSEKARHAARRGVRHPRQAALGE